MTPISIHTPAQTSGFTVTMTAAFGLAVAVVAGLLAFAPFFTQITG